MAAEQDPSAAAKALSNKGASKGGRARANVMTAQQRSEIARRAAAARWGKDPDDVAEPAEPPRTAKERKSDLPYSMFTGTLQMGNVDIECHVLNDEHRVFTQREMVRVISGGRDSGNLSPYLSGIPNYDADINGRVIRFEIAGQPTIAHGYDAELLIEVCDAYLDARDSLKPNQAHLARMAEIVVRACAKVGIIALVDEATGYQEVRKKRNLQIKLQAFIAEDMQEWARMFPDEFWYELARLEGTRYSPRHRPLRWGKYVMMFVYDAVDADVGTRLREINPNPHHKQNHHQWLQDFGRQKVHDQIQRVIAVMKTCDDMGQFRRQFDRVFSRSYQMELGGMDWDDGGAL